MFEFTDRSAPVVGEGGDANANAGQGELARWYSQILEEAQARKATMAATRRLEDKEIEQLAREVYKDFAERALDAGIRLPQEWIYTIMGELSGLGPLLELIARDDVEDIAVNLGHIYAYTTGEGWQYIGESDQSVGDGIRVLIDRAGQRPPSPSTPIVDAMLQVTVPELDGKGVRRKGLRINYIMPPASPYGDVITIRVSSYRTQEELKKWGALGFLTTHRLPPVKRPPFSPRNFARGDGMITPEAANYLLAVLVHGGTVVVAGATGSGKTFFATRLLQEMLDFFPRGAIRLFIIEDSNEIVLNGWNGDPHMDTGNIVYTVTRPEITGGPPPVTMYDLIRAALRSRPHGIVVGEARGAEAWELIRATATGHGHSVFTIHATSAEQVWPRFMQVVQAHPDVKHLTPLQVAQSFAEGVAAVVYIQRDPVHGQMVMEIDEVGQVVERTAGRPSFTPLFRFDPARGALLPTGNRPMRQGFRIADLHLTDEYFRKGGW